MTTTTIDKAGRIVLPKAVRDELQLTAGDSLELESSENQVLLRPARGKSRMYKKHGVWVLHTGRPLPPNVVKDTIQKGREEREQSLLGKRR
jgi:AbrB family looped-hinge helix DNA binding protein